MTEPKPPTFTTRFFTWLRATVTKEYKITIKTYRADDFAGLPGTETTSLTSTLDTTNAAATFADDPEKIMKFAERIGAEAEHATGNGTLHMLDVQDKHFYIYHTPWYSLPSSVFSSITKLGGHNFFRALPWCFPSFVGALPSTLPPSAIAYKEPGTDDTIDLVDTNEQRKQIIAHGSTQWDNNDLLHGYLRLGHSNIIRASGYSEIFNETTKFLVRLCRFSTTSLHIFDGHLNWMTVVDAERQRIMFVAVGGGRHPIKGMDVVNCLGGAVVMSVMWRSFLHVLAGGFANGKFPLLATDRIGPDDLTTYIASVDKDLARQRRTLALMDRFGMGAALMRGLLGPNTAEDEI